MQHFPRLLSQKERVLFFGGLGTFCLGIVALLFFGFSTLFASIPKPGGTLTEGMLGYPQLINPLYADANTVDRELTSLIYSGLLSYSPETHTLQPQLAESWSVSEDEKTYTVVLKEGSTWHDGELVTSADILFTYNAIQNGSYGSPLFDAYQNITLAQIDDRTVTFTLSEPYAAFPELLTVGILPAHLWEDIPPTNARLVALNLKPVGSGPYILSKTSRDSNGILRSVTLEANEDFVGNHPYLKEIVVKFFSQNSDLIQALQTKRINTTAALTLNESVALKDDHALQVTPLPLSQYVSAFFNTKKETLSDVNIRKALALALDIPSITAEATGNLATPLGFTLPGFLDTPAIVQDTQTAGSLLDEKGWTLGEDGKRAKNGTQLSIVITTAQRPELITSAERIADAWRALGINASVNTLGTLDIATALKEKSYDVLIAAEQYGVIADPYPFWHSSAKGGDGLNMSQFSTTDTDSAVSTLRASGNVEKRSDAYTTLSQAMIDNIPAVFLFQNVLPLVHTVDILGITSEPVPNASTRWTLESSWYKRTGIAWKR